MDDPRIKQLEWLQAIIARMAGNSFLLKGWAVTLTSALLALSAKDADKSFSLLAIFPALVFWGLDAYYLQLERTFRAQFEAQAALVGLVGIEGKAVSLAYVRTLFAKATWPIYVAIVVVTLLITYRAALR